MANNTTVALFTLANTANTAGCVDNGFITLTYNLTPNGAIQNCNSFYILNQNNIVAGPLYGYEAYWFYVFPPIQKTIAPNLVRDTVFPKLP